MDIQPATVAQIAKARDGRKVLIEEDVGGVAKRLREIDDSLRLRFSEQAGHYVVYQEVTMSDGNVEQHLVLTSQELDARIVRRVERIVHPSYDYAAELEAVDKARDAEIDHMFSETVGEAAERLAHAIRKDTGYKGKISVPGPKKG